MTGVRLLVVAEQLRRPVPGGIGTYVRGLARGLAAMGRGAGPGEDREQTADAPALPDVTFWASRPPRSGADEVAGLGTIRVSRLPGRALVWAWDRGLAGCPPGFDVLHATSLAVPPAPATPTTVMVHDLAWRAYPDAYPRRGRRWHEAALTRALAQGRVLIVPSRVTADALVAAGADHRRVEIVEEGADHLPPADVDGARQLLRSLGVEGSYLLTVSTLEPRKNLPRLLQAYAAARPELPEPWPLVVAGPAGWGAKLRPVAGTVLVGPVTGSLLAGLYQRARLMAYVPLLEGFGLPVVEAMAACTPVVASPLPSAAGAAFTVDPLDVTAMARALVAVAGHERLRAELVSAGLERARALTWRATARAHVELWSSLR